MNVGGTQATDSPPGLLRGRVPFRSCGLELPSARAERRAKRSLPLQRSRVTVKMKSTTARLCAGLVRRVLEPRPFSWDFVCVAWCANRELDLLFSYRAMHGQDVEQKLELGFYSHRSRQLNPAWIDSPAASVAFEERTYIDGSISSSSSFAYFICSLREASTSARKAETDHLEMRSPWLNCQPVAE